MELFLIDGIAPFFKDYRPGKRVNWSKIPFEHLETNGVADEKRLARITEDFDRFCRRAAETGYNAITLDDVAHMLPHRDYEPEVNAKLEVFSDGYRRWIDIARHHGLRIFITTDFMFTTPASARRIGNGFRENVHWFRDLLRRFFREYPEVEGVILRIGESDGNDVRGDFRSRLLLRTPAQARLLLSELLPVFEENRSKLVFRLWSVGAYPIGDLIWNRDTLHRVFGPFNSPSLVLSIKHGESDFFRHLPLNKQFFRSPHQKIVELQARREYEGCGEFPSYIGNDIEEIRDGLARAENVIGMSVWCQTGGWTRFRKLTYLDTSSIWNEINVWVCLRVFRDAVSAPDALRSFAAAHLRTEQGEALIDLMNGSDQAVKTLLYIDDVAAKKLFFRRVRLPSTLSVYWDRILILHPIRKILKCLVDSPDAKIDQAENALRVIDAMRKLARRNQLPDDGLDFMLHTFEILAEARRYYFLPYSTSRAAELRRLVDTYKRLYNVRYSVRLELTPFRVRSRTLRIFLRAMLREKRGYRAFDHMFTLRFLSLCFPVLRRLGNGVIPDFVHRQAMGLEAVFK